jgi:hypothetical protein
MNLLILQEAIAVINYFDIYGINKNGLINGAVKKCTCGTETSESKCPSCSSNLAKSKLLNVAKNSALAKREVERRDGNVLTYQVVHLLSTGFDLYEQTALEVTLDLETADVKISNTTAFKRQEEGKGVFAFLDKHLPGFTAMAQQVIAASSGTQFSRLVSMSEAQYKNVLHVYLNYRALFPYLLQYKILYFGSLLNLKKYYPNTDFNDLDQVTATGLNLNLLSFWDIKNTNYLETIIALSNRTDIQQSLNDMLIECKKELRDCLRAYDFDGNWALDTFGLLFNKEISPDDFIRIFNASHPREFFQMKKYMTDHKKIYHKEVNCAQIRGLTKKDIETMSFKILLKGHKKTAKEIDSIFTTLDTDPIAALKMIQ